MQCKQHLAIFIGLMLCVNAVAMMPVIDTAEIAHTYEVYEQLEQQNTKMEQQYNTMQSQYGEMKQQYGAVTGNYGWGNWENSSSDLTQNREWAASDWQSALKGMSGGNNARYQQLLSQYKESHQSMSTSSYEKGADKNLSTTYQNQVQTNQASATASSYEFDDINNHLKTLYQLGQEIESAKQNNDLKSAVDLNTRVEIEVGYISVEELRMQTLLNQQMAQLQSTKISHENEGSQFNQAGETT